VSQVTRCYAEFALCPSPRAGIRPVTHAIMSSSGGDAEFARVADTEYLVRRSMTKGYQLFSILTPPIYASFSLFQKGRGHLTVNRLLRATWLGGAVGTCHRMA
jgi:hypothetical protein